MSSTSGAGAAGDDDGADVWEVVAVAADPTGVIVREGIELTSEKVEQRLTLGAKVRQLELQGERLRFRLIAGRGPETGWVTVKVREKHLLRITDWRPSAPVEDDHFERVDAEGGASALVAPHPEKMKDIYLAPLQYEVLERVATIYKAPSTKATAVGKLQRGDKVAGFQQGRWLKLREAPGGWVLTANKEAEPLLGLVGFKLEVIRAVAEAAVLRWSKVPARAVQYRVEWAAAADTDSPTLGLDRETRTMARMHGLPPDSELRARLTARIFTEDEMYGGKAFATLVGDWEEMDTERAVDEIEESNNCIDNFSNFRGTCMDCDCSGFVMAGLGDQTTSYDFADLLCRRCSCQCLRHTIIGELVVGYGRGRAARRPAPQPPPSSKPLPPPRAQAALPASPGAWREAEHKTWRPEDAGEADRVKFVLDHIAQASTLYETLGVAPSVEDKEVRKAYRHISLHIHPDKVQNRGEQELVEQAEAAFKIVCSAYDVLNDPGQRASYDRSMQAIRPVAGTAKGGSRKDLTGISFLKKFLSKVKNFGWDLKQKPKGDWEDQGGGVYARSVGVKATIRHAVTGEELVLKKLDKGITLKGVKRLIVKETKRGPESRIELCGTDGAELQDSYRLNQSETLVLVGISLGPPVEIEVCLSHADTGARLKVKVPDTSSLQEVRAKAAEALQCEQQDLRLGCRATNRARFAAFEDETELLNGRTQMLLLGAEIQMVLTVEEATELQTELRDAYGSEWFQKHLDSLLEEYPLPDGLGERGFKESFGKLVKRAQQAILEKHGFDGPKGVFNMYQAFSEVGRHEDVMRLTWEIDQKLRVTSNGMLWQAAQVTLESCPCMRVTVESSVLVRVLLEPAFSWSEQPPLRVTLPAQSLVRKVHEAAAAQLGAQLEELQLVQGEEFEPCEASEPIGERRSFKVLGRDLPQEPQEEPPAPAEGPWAVLAKGAAWRPRFLQVALPLQSSVGQLREAAARSLGVRVEAMALVHGEDFATPEDGEPVGERRRFLVFGLELPQEEEPQAEAGEEQQAGSLRLTVLAHATVRQVREAAAAKLGVAPEALQLLQCEGLQVCGDEEPLGRQRSFKVLGVELPAGG